MLGNIFENGRKSIRILYSFWTILVIFRDKKCYPMEVGQINLEKFILPLYMRQIYAITTNGPKPA